MGSLVDILKSVAESSRVSLRDGEKSELSAVTPSSLGVDGQHWRKSYDDRVLWWTRAGYPDEAARRLAWGAIAAEWHRQYGKRVPPEVCAGCGEALSGSGADVLLLPHGERAHAGDNYDCVLQFGRWWKSAAAKGLAAIGIPAPAGVEADQ